MARHVKPVIAAVALASLAIGTAQAESQYGYSAAADAQVSAQANVDIQLTVPRLILLRVGSSGDTVDTVSFQAALDTGIPGGVDVASIADGTNQATGWNGTAPAFVPNATGATLRAFAWTNSNGGGSLTGTSTGGFIGNGAPSASAITVSSAVVTGAGLAHPGANVETFTPVTFARNTLLASDWTYAIDGAALAGISAGTYTQTVTYTATTL